MRNTKQIFICCCVSLYEWLVCCSSVAPPSACGDAVMATEITTAAPLLTQFLVCLPSKLAAFVPAPSFCKLSTTAGQRYGYNTTTLAGLGRFQ